MKCPFCRNPVYPEELKDTVIDKEGLFHKACFEEWKFLQNTVKAAGISTAYLGD